MTSYLKKDTAFNNDNVPSMLDELSLWSSYFGQVLLEHVPMRKNITLLDAGCGTGFPLFELAQRLGNTCPAHGIDIWKEGLARAQSKLDILKLENVKLSGQDAAATSFGDNKFDLITCNLGINNFELPEKVLAEWHRILKPGGGISLTTNVNGHMKEFYDIYEQVLVEMKHKQFINKLKAHQWHRGSFESLSSMLADAGFTVKKVIEKEFSLRYNDGSAMLNHFFNIIGFLDGWKNIIPAEIRQETFRFLEEKLNEKADREGGLVMRVPILYMEAIK